MTQYERDCARHIVRQWGIGEVAIEDALDMASDVRDQLPGVSIEIVLKEIQRFIIRRIVERRYGE